MASDETIQQDLTIQMALADGPPVVASPHLSPRETTILQLAMTAKPIKEMAALLGISPRTVGHYLCKMYAKLDVHSLAELALWGTERDRK